jgi:LysR family carnitine catabolism transcriptional activator
MTAKQLRLFVALAETLNFSSAADRVHLSQPAFSLALKGLEQAMGGRLFARTTRQVRLTPEGEALLPRARQLLADWEDTEQMMRQRFTLRRGHVAIAAMPSFAGNVLPRVLTAYRRKYPKVNVTILDVIHEEVLELVGKGRVELGFAFEPESADEFHFEPLFVDRFIAAVPRGPVFSRLRRITWTQLLAHPFISLQRPSTVRRLLEEALRRDGMKLAVTTECHQLATVGGLVAEGLGVSAVPALCAGQMRSIGARILPLSEPVIERRVGLIMRGDAELSVAARAMHDVASKVA